MNIDVTSGLETSRKSSPIRLPLFQVITSDEITKERRNHYPRSAAPGRQPHRSPARTRTTGLSPLPADSIPILGNKLLVLFDGRTVYSPLFSGVFWDIQDYPLEDIDHIEVISGPRRNAMGLSQRGQRRHQHRHKERGRYEVEFYAEAGGRANAQPRT